MQNQDEQLEAQKTVNNDPSIKIGETHDTAFLRDRITALEAQVEILLDLLGRYLPKQDVAPSPAKIDIPEAARKHLGNLTLKQVAVLLLLLSGATNKLIANLLGCSMSTAKTHVKSLCTKIGVKRRFDVIKTYAPIVRALSDEEFEHLTSVPKDWHRRPEEYLEVTSEIRRITR